ncbi:protein cornichon homolog 4-like isoform X1 [Carassius carassius]|uniref:protein cornichon homolog 4-like isoform X1 n=1 Tax=Carassius carassius TaxID=217509 RepID=UPI002868853B|nr:protein cornichon homolog 4-like isoform X1 [Carassius carassius]
MAIVTRHGRLSSARRNDRKRQQRKRKCKNGGGRVHFIPRRLLCFNIPLRVFRILDKLSSGVKMSVFLCSVLVISLTRSQIITLSDLECDYINARSCCSKLNKWVVPEMIAQALAMLLMLGSMHWFVFLLNFPVASWNVYRYVKVPVGNMGVYDPTEIHNRGQLKSHMKEAMIKLGFHLLCFFIYLYSMILALIND